MSDRTGMTFNSKAGEYMSSLETELAVFKSELCKCDKGDWVGVSGCPYCRVKELEEDLRISNENLEKVEIWQDKMAEVYPVVAERITELLTEGG